MFTLPEEAKVGGGRLGALPIVMEFLRILDVRKLVDFAVPPHPLHEVTHGECIEALLCAIFLGTHTLSHVEKTLEAYDLQRLFRKKGLKSSFFNDTRLGETLDTLYSQTPKLFASVVSRAMEAFQLVIERLHLDTTTITLFGSYDGPLPFLLPDEPIPSIPKFGKSKIARPDLKQLVFGMTMSQEGILLYGRPRDGNVSDVVEFRHHMETLASMLEDLRDIILVADSKLCTAATIWQAYSLNFNLVTLLPETWAVRESVINKASSEDNLPLLFTTEDGDSYFGKSYRVPFTLDGITGENGKDRIVELRFLAIFSEQLYEQRMGTRVRQTTRERETLNKQTRKLETMFFACRPDAEVAAGKALADWKLKHHSVAISVKSVMVEEKSPGRKKKGVQPTLIEKFQLVTEIQANPYERKKFSKEGMFVLLTTISDGRSLSDRKVLETYKGQAVVEVGFHWLKGPLAVAPVFLKSPKRIEVLGFVYLIALLTYGLIQRDIRSRLKKRGGKIPHPDRRRTDQPTTQGILKVFENVEYLSIPAGKLERTVMRFYNKDHHEILELLGLTNLYLENNLVYS